MNKILRNIADEITADDLARAIAECENATEAVTSAFMDVIAANAITFEITDNKVFIGGQETDHNQINEVVQYVWEKLDGEKLIGKYQRFLPGEISVFGQLYAGDIPEIPAETIQRVKDAVKASPYTYKELILTQFFISTEAEAESVVSFIRALAKDTGAHVSVIAMVKDEEYLLPLYQAASEAVFNGGGKEVLRTIKKFGSWQN